MIIYFLLFSAVVVYASTNYVILDVINSPSGMYVGVLGGMVLLLPLLLITRLTSHNAILELGEEQLQVQEQGKRVTIYYSDIATMYMNRKKPNQLEILDDRKKILYIFWPCNNGDVIEELVSFLSQKIHFKKEKKTIKSRGAHYYAITYTCQE